MRGLIYLHICNLAAIMLTPRNGQKKKSKKPKKAFLEFMIVDLVMPEDGRSREGNLKMVFPRGNL